MADRQPTVAEQRAQGSRNKQPPQPEYMTDALTDALSRHVYQCFDAAVQVRAPVTRRMEFAIYAQSLQYAPGMLPPDEAVNVYPGIIAAKTGVVDAWLASVLTHAIPELWTLQPTERPDMPDAVWDVVYARLMQEASAYNMTAEDLQASRDAYEKLARRHVKEVAKSKLDTMSAMIADMMDDGGFYAEFRQFLTDVASNVYGVMAGPEVVVRPSIVHDASAENGVTVVDRAVTRFRWVDPLAMYWSANAKCPQSAAFLIEHAYVQPDALMDGVDAQLPGFIAEAVYDVLDANRQYDHSRVPQDKYLANVRAGTAINSMSGGDLECLKFHGRVPGRLLTQYGLEGIDTRRSYEMEIWVIAGRAVRVLRNVNPMGARNFYFVSMYNKTGSIVGQGIPDRLKDIERMCGAALRNLVRNMPFASAPFGEVDKSRLANTKDASNLVIEPLKLYEVNPDPFGTGQPAFRFHDLSSHASEFMGVYEKFTVEADRLTGIPAFITGQLDVATMARTASGLSILMKAAAVVLQNAVQNIDTKLFAPLITSTYQWLMLYHPDVGVKADAKVVARGATGVLARELGQAKLHDLLNLLAPFAQARQIPPGVLLEIARQIIDGSGFDADTMIPVDAEAKAIEFANLKNNAPPAAQPQPQQAELYNRAATPQLAPAGA